MSPRHAAHSDTLSQYEALALFIARAQAAQPEFRVTEASAPVIAEICRRLDGLPLAIELAATRVKLFMPKALLARLSRPLDLLTSGAPNRSYGRSGRSAAPARSGSPPALQGGLAQFLATYGHRSVTNVSMVSAALHRSKILLQSAPDA